MGESLHEEIKKRLELHQPLESISHELSEKGYITKEIEDTLQEILSSMQIDKHHKSKKTSKKFFIKEIFDRVGYGFGSQQYVNILFFLTGASYFIIGLTNGVREVISAVFSSFLNDYSKEHKSSKQFIAFSGIVFGFCFIIMAFARFFNAVWLFVVSVILGVIGIVSYGELYHRFQQNILKDEKRGLIGHLYKYGLIITVISLWIGAFIMDRVEIINVSFQLFGQEIAFDIFGYLIAFEITAICFILSGYILSLIGENNGASQFRVVLVDFKKYIMKIKMDSSKLLSNKKIVLLVVATTIIGLVQVLGNSFYGIFIYENFYHVGFGGFLNVAMVFMLAIIASMITPVITHSNAKAYGKLPMLIFGTTLMAIMPLTYFYNPNLVSIAMGTILGIIGAAIVGISEGLLAGEIIPFELRKSYFGMNTVLTAIPYMLTVPIGAYVGQHFGLRKLFMVLGLVLVVIVVPIFFAVMFIHEVRGKTDS